MTAAVSGPTLVLPGGGGDAFHCPHFALQFLYLKHSLKAVVFSVTAPFHSLNSYLLINAIKLNVMTHNLIYNEILKLMNTKFSHFLTSPLECSTRIQVSVRTHTPRAEIHHLPY